MFETFIQYICSKKYKILLVVYSSSSDVLHAKVLTQENKLVKFSIICNNGNFDISETNFEASLNYSKTLNNDVLLSLWRYTKKNGILVKGLVFVHSEAVGAAFVSEPNKECKFLVFDSKSEKWV